MIDCIITLITALMKKETHIAASSLLNKRFLEKPFRIAVTSLAPGQIIIPPSLGHHHSVLHHAHVTDSLFSLG